MGKRKEIKEILIDGVEAPKEVVDFFNTYMIGDHSYSTDIRIDLLNVCFIVLNSINDNTCLEEIRRFAESCEMIAIAADRMRSINIGEN